MTDKEIAAPLLAWYDGASRQLPWRVAPSSRVRADAYRVWLSEIMLQQTTVAAVIPYFKAFTARWPDVCALAAAADADVMAAWAGLGYYARARNLLACARIIVANHGGRFPDTESALRALPGVGDYTAAAIAAIAFDRRAVVVDGNVERVAARLFAVEAPIPSAKRQLRQLAGRITPDRRCGDFAQAMMDLGASICRPAAPACRLCPIAGVCDARAAGIAAELPRRSPKPPRPVRFANVYWLCSGADVLLVRRPASGLLGGMLGLPMGDITESPQPCETFADAPASVKWQRVVADVRHVFTHFDLRLSLFSAELGACGRPAGEWVPVAALAGAGLPTVFRKAAFAAIGNAGAATE